MIILLSPAKNMNFDPVPQDIAATKPKFLSHTTELAQVTQKLSAAKIRKLMGISEKLANLNYERFQSFKTRGKLSGSKQAAFAFTGEVYLGLEAATLNEEDLIFAQDHLRILSGMYGLLRPLDKILPYRLEMGSSLKNSRGKNLYAFWGDILAKDLNKELKEHEDKKIINLASNEYFSAVDPAILKAEVITPKFKEVKDGKARMLMFFAKRARGAMAKWVIQNKVTHIDQLKDFTGGGYQFSKEDSDPAAMVFTRPQPAPGTGHAAAKQKVA